MTSQRGKGVGDAAPRVRDAGCDDERIKRGPTGVGGGAGRLSATGVDRGEVLRRLRDFATHWSGTVAKWESTAAPHTEKSYAQSFWSDLLGCFGINASRRDLPVRVLVRAALPRRLRVREEDRGSNTAPYASRPNPTTKAGPVQSSASAPPETPSATSTSLRDR